MGKIKIWLIDDQNIRWKCSKDLHPVIALPKVCTQQSITWWWLFDVLYIHDMIIEQDWHHQKSLICIWMACHALVWSRQEQRYEEFKSVLSANLNVQIWCKYFGPKSALLRFFSSFALSDVVCNKRGQRYEEFKSGKCTACQMLKSATLLSCVV